MPLHHRTGYTRIVCDRCGREQYAYLYFLDDLRAWMYVHGWADRVRDDGDCEYLCGGCR